MNEFRTEALTWPAPVGLASFNKVPQEERFKHYLATTKTLLADGTSVIPNRETLKLIFNAWDTFGLEVVISSDSYIVKD